MKYRDKFRELLYSIYIRNKLVFKSDIYFLPFSLKIARFKVRVMVFNATFNNISIKSWRSVLLVKETGVPGENH
jgi:hypothetical protein